MTDNKAIRDRVEKSYGACRMTGTFTSDFYSLFLGLSPRISAKFSGTNMEHQQRMLDHGIRHLIRYFHEPNAVTVEKMNALSESHSKTELNIEPDLYPFFLEALLKTVATHDPDFDTDTEEAWRMVTAHGIAAMQAVYDK